MTASIAERGETVRLKCFILPIRPLSDPPARIGCDVTLKAQGIPLQQEADESTTGPASFVVVDPDGNPILVDQHV